jgi:hypothetical protein
MRTEHRSATTERTQDTKVGRYGFFTSYLSSSICHPSSFLTCRFRSVLKKIGNQINYVSHIYFSIAVCISAFQDG